MDQPRQRISGNACHEQREQRVLCHPLGHGSLARTNVPLGLWVSLCCLLDVAFASIIQFTGLSRRLLGNVVQGFPDLIQNLSQLSPAPVGLPDQDDQAQGLW